eukprot:364039-Chlamydomonas_euryale.AAC.7
MALLTGGKKTVGMRLTKWGGGELVVCWVCWGIAVILLGCKISWKIPENSPKSLGFHCALFAHHTHSTHALPCEQGVLAHPAAQQLLRGFLSLLRAADGIDVRGDDGGGAAVAALDGVWRGVAVPLLREFPKLLSAAHAALRRCGGGGGGVDGGGGSKDELLLSGVRLVCDVLPAAVCFDVFCARRPPPPRPGAGVCAGSMAAAGASALAASASTTSMAAAATASEASLLSCLQSLLLLGEALPQPTQARWLGAVRTLLQLADELRPAGAPLPNGIVAAAGAAMAAGSALSAHGAWCAKRAPWDTVPLACVRARCVVPSARARVRCVVRSAHARCDVHSERVTLCAQRAHTVLVGTL